MLFYISLSSWSNIKLCTMVDRERFSIFRVDHWVQKSGHPCYKWYIIPQGFTHNTLKLPRVLQHYQHISTFSLWTWYISCWRLQPVSRDAGEISDHPSLRSVSCLILDQTPLGKPRSSSVSCEDEIHEHRVPQSLRLCPIKHGIMSHVQK
jgi:hypothetical protein